MSPTTGGLWEVLPMLLFLLGLVAGVVAGYYIVKGVRAK